MGLVIAIIMGASFGWLASMMVDREGRLGTAICTLAGTAGAVIGALVAGNVPLATGISPTQLLWAVLGSILAIVAVNAAGVTRLGADRRNV